MPFPARAGGFGVVGVFSVSAVAWPIRVQFEDGRMVSACLFYDARDPFAVALLFDGDAVDQSWLFARSLLTAGLMWPTGDGDVHVAPTPMSRVLVDVTLCSPDGKAVLRVSRAEVGAFLRATYDQVPAGEESIGAAVDALLTEIFGSGFRVQDEGAA